MRLAAIDLGSNTVRLLVAEVDAQAGFHCIESAQLVTRLGTGLLTTGSLAPEAIERTLAAVEAYRARARALGAERVIAVATAAVREAENGEAFVARLAAGADLELRVATGQEEARLSLLGASWGLPALAHPFCLVDIGGGSTELVVGDGPRPLGGVSLRLGVVGLAERYLHADPIDWAEYAACGAHVAARLAAEAWPRIQHLAPRALVGTAGTVTTLAALDLGLPAYEPARVHGVRLTAAAVRVLLLRLGELPVAERARLPCLEPGRADLIIPGIAIVLGILEGLDQEALVVSDTALREGILLDAIGWTPAVP